MIFAIRMILLRATKTKPEMAFFCQNNFIETAFGPIGIHLADQSRGGKNMTSEKSCKELGRIAVLPREYTDLIVEIEKLRRGGMAGADKASTW